MKRKIDLVEEEHESEHDESEFSGDESEDEEQRIKDVLSHLSRALPEMRVSDFPAYYGRVQRYSFLDPQRTITSLSLIHI